MAEQGRRAQEVLRAWAETEVPRDDPEAAELRRRRVIAATSFTIARAAKEQAEQARRRRWLRIGVATASAAAVLLAAGAVWRSRAAHEAQLAEAAGPAGHVQLLAGTIHPSHEGRPLPSVSSDGRYSLGPGDEVTTEPSGRGELTLTDGVAITLEPQTHVRLPEARAAGDKAAALNERVGLDMGSVFVRVPPLSSGHSFSIRTPDAEVTVHGTAFTVEVLSTQAAPAPTATRVRVSSGVVSVKSAGQPELFLTAGMEWASPDLPRTAATPPAAVATAATGASMGTTATPPSTGTGTRPGTHRRGTASGGGRSESSSTLAEENRLLEAAAAASNGGDYGTAIATLNELLRRFPGSPLAPEAKVARFRALEKSGDIAAAAREARAYLAAYPEGAAREEAKRVAVEQ
jgi:hypothetical protein